MTTSAFSPDGPTLPARSGLGTLCRESQADGVPCTCASSDCALCARAANRLDDRPISPPPPDIVVPAGA